MTRTIQRMHDLFGRDYLHKCGQCINFNTETYLHYKKCQRYGVTSSAASNWAGSWMACGKFNAPMTPGEKSITGLLKFDVEDEVEHEQMRL